MSGLRALEDFPPLFLTCECGRMAQILLGTPWGLGSYCVRCASAKDLHKFAARRFLEVWPDGGSK